MIPAQLGSWRHRAPCTAIALVLAIALGAGCGASTSSPSSPTVATATNTARPATARTAPPKTVQLNAPGAAVDVLAALPAGYVTVVDFWSVSCEACIVQGEKLATGVAEEPRVLIRKVDVGDGDTPVAAAYKIAVLPHFFIYDKQKRLRYDLLGPDCSDAAKYAKQLAAE
jgi:thiol-disulfide isomerase/thioredoxin